MSVTAGSRLGSYEILAFVGAGGMGEVYRARDTRLGRDVAIKLLHPGDRANQRRRQRFLQEARTAAALNHPNIATVHDIVSVDGTDFIVMEYVDGQTLGALLRSGLPLPEVLRVAMVIADALARAHGAGIVHRDLKPANVLVASDGTVKVLDFGLAKLVEPEEAGGQIDQVGQDQTITEEVAPEALSRPGAIMGSPGYMSPEQATGSRVDTRSDIFSFGSMLYEMATGRRAFLGDSVASTLAKVAREEPAMPSEVTPNLPRELERLILRCLRKQPDRRIQHIVDVKVELQEIKDELESAAGTAPVASGRRRARWLATALGVFVAVIVATWTLVGQRRRESPPTRLVPLTATSGIEATPAFSPDGSQMVYAWDGARPTDQQRPSFDIWLKLLAGPEARRLTTNPADDLGPSWSPDGRQIAFLRGRLGESGTVYLVSPLGGPERKLSDLPVAGSDASWLRGAAIPQLSWSPDGRWLAVARARAPGDSGASAGGIHLIPLAGGEAHPVTFPRTPSVDRDPVFSPEGRRLAYASCPAGPFAACDLQVVALDGQMKPRSPPRQVARAELSVFGLAWSADGSSLVYGAAQGGLARLWRVTLDGSRPAERIELARQGLSPAIAPGANRLAFVQIRKDTDIYSFEVGRPNTAVVFSSSPDSSPSFSPDGRRIVFASGRSGEVNELWLADADGSNPMQLTHGPGSWQGSPSWSPDGRRIAFDSRGQDGLADIWSIDADGGGQRRVTDRPGNEVLPSWSRDGQWIYHRQDRADGHDIWRVPSTGGAAARVTFNGGLRVLESADGKTLFFVPRDDESPLFSQPAAGGPARQIADCVLSRSLASGPDGLYYVACPVGLLEGPLHRLDPLTGDSRRIGTLSTGGGFVNGLTVAPDGGRILFTRLIADDADLMMIEGFR